MNAPLLEAVHVSKTFGSGEFALSDVSVSLHAGQALCVVGESGSGKSTLLRLLAGLDAPTHGELRFAGTPLGQAGRALRREFRRSVRMVFQDPFASLNPIKRIEHNLIRPLRLVGHGAGAALDRRVAELLESVGLPRSVEFRKRFPHELSGGQRQRVSIARALASNPKILLADEPTSMLDVSIRANVQALLGSLQRDRGIALLYVTHDLRSARLVAPELFVMHSGRVVEQGRTGELLSRPAHPYTRSLLAALPGSHVAPLPMASPAAWRAQTGGCSLVQSCPNALEKCGRSVPPLEPRTDSAGSPRSLRCYAPLSRQY